MVLSAKFLSNPNSSKNFYFATVKNFKNFSIATNGGML